MSSFAGGPRRRLSMVLIVSVLAVAMVAGVLASAPFVPVAAAQTPPPEEPPRPKGDVVFVVDESSSMGADIADVKARIGDVIGQLASADVDFRIGVVGYSAGNRVYQPLTDDPALIQAGVNRLTTPKGNPEAGFSATVVAMGDELAHRPDAATCEVLISDEDADVNAAYPSTKADALAALRARDASFFGVVLASGQYDYGPQVGSLAAETLGGTFDLNAFRTDAGPVLDALMDDCITKITSQTPLEVSAGEDVTVPEGSTVSLAGSATSGVQGVEARGRFAVGAKSDIFAAGLAAPVSAGGVLPVEVGNMVAGTSVSFSGATGTTRVSSNCATGTIYPPDGAGGNIDADPVGAISGISAEDSQTLVGVFIGDSAPTGAPPFQMNYRAGRTEFEVSRPLVGQTFWVGDGLSPAGVRHRFVVPDGATRLYLGLARASYTTSCGGYEIDVESSTGPAPITYDWQLVSSAGPPVQLSAANAADPSFSVFDDGTYQFRMTATDGVETLSDDVSVTVTNELPMIATIASDAAATDGLAEVTVAYSDPGPFDTHAVSIDWGDGSPVESFPAQAGGTGWGYAYAGHRYPTVGPREVTARVIDDDGGASEPATTTVDVGGAGVGETLPSQPAALFAGSNDIEAIRVSGSQNSVTGVAHSNGGIRISGSNHHYTGGTEYATTLNVSGSGTVFDPPAVQRPATAFPSTHVWADYQPGGRAAVAAGSLYRQIPASECKGGKWKPKAPLTAGLYAVPCGVQISGSDFAGNVTIAASGELKLSGSGHSLTPFTDGLLFFSSSTSTRAIDLSGSNQSFAGSMLAPSGGIEVSGSQHQLGCGVMGQLVRISGSNNQIAGVECGQSGGGQGTTVSIAAPPIVAPTLTTALAADRADAFPGDAIVTTATLRNGLAAPSAAGSTTVLMPVLVGVDNRDTAPVTVGQVVYTFEVHDPSTAQWTTWASTDPAAPAEQRIVTLSGQPTPTAGVTYATGYTDTTIVPGALGSWASAAKLDLSTDQTIALLDPARVDAVRNSVTIQTDRPLVRKITRFDDNPLEALRTPPAASVSDAKIVVSKPGGGVDTFDTATTAELATLVPGASATVASTSTVAVPEPAAEAETDSAYGARLAELDNRAYVGAAYGVATAGVGGIFAGQQLAQTTVHVPVLSATLEAPSQVAPSSAVPVSITITNTGSAEATDLTVDLDVSGRGTVAITGLPATLAPGATATGTATFTTSATPGGYGSSATVLWSHPGGAPGLYGPLRPSATTQSKPPVALQVVKHADAETLTNGISYVIQATNTGTNPLTAVTLTDPIDGNATLVAGSAATTAGTITSGSTAADRSVAVDVGVLAPGANVVVSFDVDYLRAEPGTTQIANQATVASTQLGPVLSDDPTRPGTADANITPITVPSSGGGGGPDGTNNGPIEVACDPADGATITAPTPFSCTITPLPGTEVATWNASIIPIGGSAEQAVILTTGTGPIALGEIDPTTLPNGLFDIVIIATDTVGGRSELTSSLVVDGFLKPGRYSVTYRDMAVPVASLPVQVFRTYDSLDRSEVGDFGHGWTLDVSNFEVQVNRALGDSGWVQYQCGVAVVIATYCYTARKPHFVTVTWPDGRTESFDLTPTKSPPAFSFLTNAAYTRRAGTTGTSTLSAAPGDEFIMWAGGSSAGADLYVPFTNDHYDPSRFVLTGVDGTKYLLDIESGLVEATDPNGNRLTVSDDGVVSSAGPSLRFERDDLDRITSVVGPDGKAVRYRYDPNGDLDQVTDERDNVTTHSYQPGHYLDVTDDAGPGVWRRLGYDADGRLTTVTDARGNVTNYTNDVPGRKVTVTSPDGNHNTITTFDDRGRPVVVDEVFDGAVHRTQTEWSADDMPVRRTDPNGAVVSGTYDAKRNLTSYTDATNKTWRYTYERHGVIETATDPLGHRTSYSYDQYGNQVLVVAPDGGRTTRTFDLAGNVRTETDPVGRMTQYTTNAAGWVTQLTDPRGFVTTQTHDTNGRVVSKTDPANGVTTYEYDAAGNPTVTIEPGGLRQRTSYDHQDRPTSTVDAAGYMSTVAYDGAGNVVSSTNGAGEATTYGYDARNLVVTETDPTGLTSTLLYDGGGRETGEVRPDGVATAMTLDAAGRVMATSSTGRGTTTFTRDGNGRLLTSTAPDGGVTTFGYDDAGQATTTTDPLGRVTTTEFDAMGRVHKVTQPGGRTTTIVHDQAGQQRSVTQADGGVSTVEYDGNGNPTRTVDPLGRTAVTTYDNLNRPESDTQQGSATVTYDYDAAGFLTSSTSPAGLEASFSYDPRGMHRQVIDGLGNRETFLYDGAGRVTAKTDRNGHTTLLSYDAAGRLLRETDPTGASVVRTYQQGRLTALTDADGRTRTFGYDAAGELTTTTDALGRTRTVTFDASGRATESTNGRGQTSTFEYDAAGQLIESIRPEGTITYGYDAAGRRETMVDPHGETRWTYDQADRVTSVVSPEGSVGHGYDLAGQRTSTTTSEGTTSYEFDPLGRVSSVTDPAGARSELDWLPDNRLESVSRPNGITTSYGYDDAGRLTSLSHAGAGGTVAEFTYTLDPNGNRRSVSSNLGDAEFDYDELDRLTASETGGLVEAFEYDRSGNIVSHARDGDVTTHTYDAAGQRSTSSDADATVDYSYDDDGNLTGTTSGDLYTWDSTGMMTEATIGGSAVTYEYDGDGTRTSVDGVDQLWDPTTGKLLANGSETATHSPAGVLSTRGSGATEYPLADGLGSIRATTDGDGDVLATADYSAYGELIDGSTSTGTFGFTGEQTDPNGLLHLRARQYDPAGASFINPDTVQPNAGGTQGWNPYSYTAGNPVNRVDPSGHTATGAAPIVANPGAGAFTTVTVGSPNITTSTGVITAEGFTPFRTSAESAASSIRVGESQQARPGGGSSLIAYGMIASAAVLGSWFFTRLGVYNSVVTAATSQLLADPPRPRALASATRRQAKPQVVSRKVKPGDCAPAVGYLVSRAQSLNMIQATEQLPANPKLADSWRSTAVARAHFMASPWLCFDFVASGAQRQFGDQAPSAFAALQANEIPVFLPGAHAETTAVAWATVFGYIPIALGINRDACGASGGGKLTITCHSMLTASQAIPVMPFKGWIWPGALPLAFF